jgi:hypothetical protein
MGIPALCKCHSYWSLTTVEGILKVKLWITDSQSMYSWNILFWCVCVCHYFVERTYSRSWFGIIFNSELYIEYHSMFGVWVPVEARFSPLYVIQTCPGAHPAFHPVGIGSSFPGGKATGAGSWPLTSKQCQGQEYMDLYIHSPIHLRGVVLN